MDEIRDVYPPNFVYEAFSPLLQIVLLNDNLLSQTIGLLTTKLREIIEI